MFLDIAEKKLIFQKYYGISSVLSESYAFVYILLPYSSNFETARMQKCRARRELSKATIEAIWIDLDDKIFTITVELVPSGNMCKGLGWDDVIFKFKFKVYLWRQQLTSTSTSTYVYVYVYQWHYLYVSSIPPCSSIVHRAPKACTTTSNFKLWNR